MQPSTPPRSHLPLNLSAIGSDVTQPNAAALKSAEQEADFYASDKKKRGHKRDQFSRDVVHYGANAIIVLIGLCVVSGFVVWTAHRILPDNYCWLDKSHLDFLTEGGKYLLSGGIGALGSKFISRNIEPD